jgi:type VI secretion system protein
MPLVLTIAPLGGGRGGDRQVRTLGQGTMSIGRAAGNDWALPDPEQTLSRTHCSISFESGHYVLTDLSTNGMLINGAREATSRNSRTVLTDGDTVQLGGYVLEVAEADGPAGHAGGPFGASSFASSGSDPFAAHGDDDPLAIDPLEAPPGQAATRGFHHPLPHHPPSLRNEDPFDSLDAKRPQAGTFDDDLFRGKRPLEEFAGPTQSDRVDAPAQSFSAPRVIRPVDPSSIDFDELIGDLSPTPSAPSPPAAPPFGAPQASSPFGAHQPQPSPFQAPSPPPPASQFAPPPPQPFPAQPMARQPVPQQPFAPPPVAAPAAPFGVPAAPVPAPTPFGEPETLPELSPFGEPTTEPAQFAPAARPAPAAPAATPPVAAAAAPAVAAAPASGPAAAALIAAFLEGAGVPKADLSATDPEAAMRAIGSLFYGLVAGTRDVLMSRAEIKNEMRVEQTMLRARDNNALKFSITAEEAVLALLTPNRPGYKPPLAAVDEAFKDIRSHEMAVMAGVQTALMALLKRFDPAALEARLQKGTFDAILPGARKARFWELFCSTYKEIAREAEDDFQAVFGREFARAYAAQVSKL